jgi:hypothetical protein
MATLAGPSSPLRPLIQAIWNYLNARLRNLGFRRISPSWQARAAICESCHLRVVRCGISYCGNPLLQQIDRDPTIDGCGCPCRDKAKSPDEHCPIDSHHQPARFDRTSDASSDKSECSCKWCEAPGV